MNQLMVNHSGYPKPKKRWRQIQLLILPAALCIWMSLAACHHERTTHIFGRVTDSLQQPIANVPILILSAGYLLAKGSTLAEVVTDKQGLYSATVIAPTGTGSIDVLNQYFTNPDLSKQYPNCDCYYDGKRVKGFCSILIGQTTVCNFVLLP